MMTRRLFLAIVSATIFACSKTDAPIEPVWGKEPCAHCAMVLSDRRFGAQTIQDGERHFFDDIGCVVLWGEKHPKAQIWTRGGGGQGWTDAKAAKFSTGARTPMDFGVEASADGTLGWSSVREQVLAKDKARP